MEKNKLKKTIEAMLFSTTGLISAREICDAFSEEDRPGEEDVTGAIDALDREFGEEALSVQILRIAEKYRLCVRPEFAEPVKRLLGIQMMDRLTRPALETLAIIAYRQPISKAEIESIRGVKVDGILRKLAEKGLAQVTARTGDAGRAYMYETTERFLDHFGLNSLKELPKRKELVITDGKG